MDKNLDYTLMYRVAKAYYQDQRTQQEIADMENFSRSQVSRLLKRAPDEGLVTSKLVFPGMVDEVGLAARLEASLGLERVVLVPSFFTDYAKADRSAIYKNLAMGAAEQIPRVLADAKTIGVGWGRSVYNTSLNLRPHPSVADRIFVPLIGYMGDNNPALQINTIVDRFGQMFYANRKYINLPSLQSCRGYDMNWHQLQDLQKKWDALDAAVVGIGASPVDDWSLLKEFPDNYRDKVLASAARGDILSQFFTADGKTYNVDDFGCNVQLIALKLEKLRSVKNVIAIAAGIEKYEAICVAAEKGYIKTLITDFNTADGIIQLKGAISS